MFNWLKQMFGKGKKEMKPSQIKKGPDLLARQGGQKRNRYHIYHQPYGYPIRACDWIAVDIENLDDIKEVGDEGGLAIRIMAGDKYKRICSHCLRIAHGERTSIGQINHGHGKGAPIK